MPAERWRDIPGYEGAYQASDRGRIRSLERTVRRADERCNRLRSRVLKPYPGRTSPYMQVQLCRCGTPRNFMVHRLVAMTFLAAWDPALEVNHRDGDKLNNRLENLEMCTRQENFRHAVEHRLKHDYGEEHASAKLTNAEARKIRNLHRWGIRQVDLAGMYRVCKQTVCNVIHYKTYFHEDR